jgi:hypothetical protein
MNTDLKSLTKEKLIERIEGLEWAMDKLVIDYNRLVKDYKTLWELCKHLRDEREALEEAEDTDED